MLWFHSTNIYVGPSCCHTLHIWWIWLIFVIYQAYCCFIGRSATNGIWIDLVDKKCTTKYWYIYTYTIHESCKLETFFLKCKIRQAIYDVKWSLDCKLGLVHFLTFLNRSQRNQSDIFPVYFMYYTMLKPIVSKLLGVNLTMATIDWLVFFLYHQFIYKITTIN